MNAQKKKKCFEFFTLGGSQRWEDVFFYQKWRIQRNYKTKKYRLLDNWDIRRESGSFDDCYKTFLKKIEIYQLGRQRGHMVIMLHGVGESKNVFKPLWREIIKYNFHVAAVNYPSTYKRIDAHVRQLDFFLNHLEDVKEISFITKGCGALILRKLLYFDADWKKRIKVRRIIEINPISNGSNFWKNLSRFSWIKKLIGSILTDIVPNGAKKIPQYAPQYHVGILVCETYLSRLLSFLPRKIRQYLPFYEDYMHEGAKDTTKILATTMRSLHSMETASKCVKFLKSGEF